MWCQWWRWWWWIITNDNLVMITGIHLGFWSWLRPVTLAGEAEGGGAIFDSVMSWRFISFSHKLLSHSKPRLRIFDSSISWCFKSLTISFSHKLLIESLISGGVDIPPGTADNKLRSKFLETWPSLLLVARMIWAFALSRQESPKDATVGWFFAGITRPQALHHCPKQLRGGKEALGHSLG